MYSKPLLLGLFPLVNFVQKYLQLISDGIISWSHRALVISTMRASSLRLGPNQLSQIKLSRHSKTKGNYGTIVQQSGLVCATAILGIGGTLEIKHLTFGRRHHDGQHHGRRRHRRSRRVHPHRGRLPRLLLLLLLLVLLLLLLQLCSRKWRPNRRRTHPFILSLVLPVMSSTLLSLSLSLSLSWWTNDTLFLPTSVGKNAHFRLTCARYTEKS